MNNKVITIYELMGLIKDGKAPKKVFYNGSEYKFSKDIGDYRRLGWGHCLIIKDVFIFGNYPHNSLYNMLSDTVEILPEESEWEDIEEIQRLSDCIINEVDGETQLMNINAKDRLVYIPIINQLINNQKYLKEKLESKDD